MARIQSKATFIMVNGDAVIGIIYENETYGRTLVIQGKLDPNYDVKVYSAGTSTVVNEGDFLEYLHSLLPV